MKRILITGKDSYIGTSFEKYLQENYPGEFEIATVDMIDGKWKEKDFSGYDTVFHVAEISHIDTGKVSQKEQKRYYALNTDLTIETAKKAKADGVKQFIFLSSIIVYGVGESQIITEETKPNPSNFYGASKLKAEEGIQELNDDCFRVVILRTPMIYGPNCNGYYSELSKRVNRFHVFTQTNTQLSIIYIDNLCEYIKQKINCYCSGIFYPKNEQNTNKDVLIKYIAKANKKKIKILPKSSPVIKIMEMVIGLQCKAFDGLIYDENISLDASKYCLIKFKDSIDKSEKHRKKILVISQYFYPEQFRINDIASEWVKRSYDVSVITGIPNYPEGKFYNGYTIFKNVRSFYNGIKIKRLPILPRGKTKYTLALNYLSFIISGTFWSIFTKETADVVFIFGLSPIFQALPGILYSKKKNVPCYLYLQDLWPESFEIVTGINKPLIHLIMEKIVNYIYINSSVILITSRGFTQHILKYNISRNKIQYWPQYAEDLYYPLSLKENKEAEEFRIIFTGNVGEGQGLDILPNVAEYMNNKNPNNHIVFQIVGNGSYKNKLLDEIKKKKVQSSFIMTAAVHPSQIPEILANADMALLSLKSNSIFKLTVPAKLQSYMACGKAILALVDGESRQIIEDAHAGICITSKKISDIGDEIMKISSTDENLIKEMEENSLKYSQENFSKLKLMNQMDELMFSS